eukprot:531958-Rhodomonas_salina.3
MHGGQCQTKLACPNSNASRSVRWHQFLMLRAGDGLGCGKSGDSQELSKPHFLGLHCCRGYAKVHRQRQRPLFSVWSRSDAQQ